MEQVYGFATLEPTDKEVTGSNWQLKSLLEFSQEEYSKCVEACAILDTYKKDAQLFQIVIWNYEDYNRLVNDYLDAYIHKRIEVLSNRLPDLNLNRCLMNFLSSVRSYLDYVETNVKRKYGKTSPNSMKFKLYCSEAYDGSFSYRFLYRFRNYAQHCGLPLTRVFFNAEIDETASKKLRRELDIGVNRDELLDKKFDWGNVEQEISEQPETIKINHHVDEMMECLKEIHSKYIADEFVNLKESATYLNGLIQKIPTNVEGLHLFRFSRYLDGRPPHRVSFRVQIVHLDLIHDVFDERFAILFEGNK